MKQKSIIWIPIIIAVFVIAAALSWKFLGGETNTVTTDASGSARTLPRYGQLETTGSAGFGVDTNPATSDISRELNALEKEFNTSDLDALDKQVGSL